MHKNFEVNRTKIKGVCQFCSKAATQDSKSDLSENTYFLMTHSKNSTQKVSKEVKFEIIIVFSWLIQVYTVSDRQP